MAKQDDFVRITLRLPPELHASLAEAAGAASLNAEIVARLAQSFEPKPDMTEFAENIGKQVIVTWENSLQRAFDRLDGIGRDSQPLKGLEDISLLDWLEIRGVDTSKLKRNPKAVNRVKRQAAETPAKKRVP